MIFRREVNFLSVLSTQLEQPRERGRVSLSGSNRPRAGRGWEGRRGGSSRWLGSSGEGSDREFHFPDPLTATCSASSRKSHNLSFLILHSSKLLFPLYTHPVFDTSWGWRWSSTFSRLYWISIFFWKAHTLLLSWRATISKCHGHSFCSVILLVGDLWPPCLWTFKSGLSRVWDALVGSEALGKGRPLETLALSLSPTFTPDYTPSSWSALSRDCPHGCLPIQPTITQVIFNFSLSAWTWLYTSLTIFPPSLFGWLIPSSNPALASGIPLLQGQLLDGALGQRKRTGPLKEFALPLNSCF